MVWQPQLCHGLPYLLKQNFELERVKVGLWKVQLGRLMDPNGEIAKQNQVNHISIPAPVTKALHESSDKSWHGQDHVLSSLLFESNQDEASPTAICAGCVALAYQKSIASRPMNKPLHSSVNQAIKQVLASASRTTALQTLKSHGEVYMLESLVPGLIHDEAFSTAISPGNAPSNYQRSVSPTTSTITPLKAYRTGNINETFPSASCTRVQQNSYKNRGEVGVLTSSMPDNGAVSCAQSARSKIQNISPKPFTAKPRNVNVASSNNYVFWCGYLNSQQNHVASMSSVNFMSEVGNGAVPFVDTTAVQPAKSRGSHPPHFEEVACGLGWNKVHPTCHMERCKLMKQQSKHRQSRLPLTIKASSLDHWGSRNRSLREANESYPINTKTDHNAGLRVPNNGFGSPALYWQLYDICDPSVINPPKCISIRADSYIHRLKVPNSQKTALRVASNSPGKYTEPYHGRHRVAYTMNEVQEQIKVVELAENLACVAFPQGMYKTEMCNKWERSMGQYCPYGEKCQFAHGPQELRPVLRHHRYKTILCRMVAAGEPCPYEHRCHFRHVIYPHEAALLASKPIMNSASSTCERKMHLTKNTL